MTLGVHEARNGKKQSQEVLRSPEGLDMRHEEEGGLSDDSQVSDLDSWVHHLATPWDKEVKERNR